MAGFMSQICEPFTKRQRDILAARDWHGEDEWKRMNSDYESLLAFRKTIKGKPDIYQQAQLALNQIWIDYYKYALFHNNNCSDCTCRRCEEKRQAMTKLKFIPQSMACEFFAKNREY